MTTEKKVYILISLSVIGFIIQLYFQQEGFEIYNIFLKIFTINDSSIHGFLSANFLHANIIHLSMNMIMLYLLSKMYSIKSSIISVYIISLIFSSTFSYIYIYLFTNVYVLGASGAIFGVFSYIYFKLNREKEFYLNFFIINIGMVLLNMNIAWYAHLGGSIGGYLFYYLEKKGIIKEKRFP